MFLTATQVEELLREQARKERQSLNKIWEPYIETILDSLLAKLVDNNLESHYNDGSTNEKELHTHGNSHIKR